MGPAYLQVLMLVTEVLCGLVDLEVRNDLEEGAGVGWPAVPLAVLEVLRHAAIGGD